MAASSTQAELSMNDYSASVTSPVLLFYPPVESFELFDEDQKRKGPKQRFIGCHSSAHGA
jgi:hypothetical protein